MNRRFRFLQKLAFCLTWAGLVCGLILPMLLGALGISSALCLSGPYGRLQVGNGWLLTLIVTGLALLFWGAVLLLRCYRAACDADAEPAQDEP